MHIRAGRLRPLAVSTTTRLESVPDIPTVGDFVPGFETSAWGGIGAPKDTPGEIIDKLNREINAALADPKMNARLADLGGLVLPLSLLLEQRFGTYPDGHSLFERHFAWAADIPTSSNS